MKRPARFAQSAYGRWRTEEPTGSPFEERAATRTATPRRGKAFFCAGGILAWMLGAVGVVDQPRALAQTQPEGQAAGEADGDDAKAANPGQGAVGFMGGMGKMGSGKGGMGGGMGGMGFRMGGHGAKCPRQGNGGFAVGMGVMGGAKGGKGGKGGSATQSPRQELEARIAPLLNKFRKAKDDSQRKAIKRELSSILDDYFD